MQISDNFNLHEFITSVVAINNRIDNAPTPDVIDNIITLVKKVLQPTRNRFKKPIMVNSGYRCERLNKIVGGVRTSQHLTGKAADITAGSKQLNKQLYNLIKDYCIYDQLINEKDYSWIHVSYNEDRNRMEAFSK